MPPMMRATAQTATATATMIKPYNITFTGENDAEINMYGEVVDARPVDWWTGKPVEGNFIAVDEFLADIAELETRDNITVHINSVGGSLYGGLSIYNRLKNMKPNITTIIDGLAASAGSLIFQAGNTRKVNSASNMMIHGALGFLYGYYNVKDLKDATKQLDAGTKAAVNALAEASGNTVEDVRTWVDKETWYTGQEIVDAGFADEVIEDENSIPVAMSLSHDKAFLIANGVALSTYGMKNIPANIPIMPKEANTTQVITEGAQTPPIDNNNNSATGGNSTMANTNSATTIATVDELRTAYPEFVAQIEAEANAAGAANERARLQGIEAIRNAVGNTELVNDAMYGENRLTAEQLAYKAMQAQAAIGTTVVNQLEADADASGANAVNAVPNGANAGDPDVDEKAAVQNIIDIVNGIKA